MHTVRNICAHRNHEVWATGAASHLLIGIILMRTEYVIGCGGYSCASRWRLAVLAMEHHLYKRIDRLNHKW